ncbi:hypothetical protein Calab_3307 [Caldithrix abyssi DSM 13497]|uniref:Transmembrane protein n=1 Tax=Caldithrix abyssi DSM 13497 TaxID=880073 RepID=H1XVL1_CALAY|nr:hypothetical protein [Caldithrix abyssi]APF18953.1 hypothetical protein Cabys_2204 [Caldithrix abyssi DSM 13497]EHO42911.1 hypothetical protein Calab_3307 [Caldithrix abyssi DSM 13497]
MFLRFLPMIFADLLFAAHVMRFQGLYPALAVVLLLGTLFIRRAWVPGLWQVLLLLAIGEWLRVTAMFIRFRLAMDLPYIRLLIIMGLVILFFVFVIFWWQNDKIQAYFKNKSETGKGD